LELEAKLDTLFLVENLEPTNNFTAPLPKENVISNAPFPTPDNPPWNGWIAAGVWLASVFFIFIFPAIFLIPYLLTQGIKLSDNAKLIEVAQKDPTAILLQLISVIPAHVFTLLLAWIVVTKYNKYSFRETLGWKMGGFRMWHVVAVVVFFYVLALSLTLTFGERDNEFMQMLKSSRAAVYLVAFFATFTAPLVEEVVYRGILYSAFQRSVGVVYAVIIVTLMFAAVHVPQYSKDFNPDFVTIFVICLLSLILTLIRVRTGNLLPCVVLHTVFNGSQSVLLILEPYLEELSKKPSEQAAFFFSFFK
jgi:membrane protease YdiL (CAAX protease family)